MFSGKKRYKSHLVFYFCIYISIFALWILVDCCTYLLVLRFVGYVPSDTSLLPCYGVSRRAVSIYPYGGSEFLSSQMKIISLKRSFKHPSFICKAGPGGQRRNPDFPRQNRHIFSRNRNRPSEERDNSENLDESEFISTKTGPILAVSNGPKSNATATPGQKEREIVELFRKVQGQLRERAAVKEGKKFETAKEPNKESESVDSLLKLLRKHSVEQGKRKVNGGDASEANFDRPRQIVKPVVDKTKSFPSSTIVAKEEPEETEMPSVSRPVSSFRRRSPVPRVKYEPIVSSKDTYDSLAKSDLDVSNNEAHYEPADFESESDLEPDLDLVSGLELDQEEELEELEEPEIELDPKIEFVGKAPVGDLSESEAEVSYIEEDVYEEKGVEKQHSEVKDLNVIKLVELRAIAKERGMKGFSKLKKAELIGLLSDDSSLP